MENVTIVGTEAGVLVLATENGQRFALPIDDLLRAEIRRARAQSTPATPRLAASPREIQAHIRSGLSAAEVAELLGIARSDVERFEGPVLAEREHVVGQALAVPVLIGSEVEPDAQPTFGTAIRAKLADVDAASERWVSWKEESGWIIKLEFTANEVEHDARWSFDPRRSTLAPLNTDATQLSRQGSLPDGLIPRLRAVESERQPSPYKDETRFDSGAFGPRLIAESDAEHSEPAADRMPSAAQNAAIKRAPEESSTSPETADLLEALRRRRGQRESAPLDLDEHEDVTPPSPIALFETPEPAGDANRSDADSDQEPIGGDSSSRKRRRNAMPSWDEIVFGARTDE